MMSKTFFVEFTINLNIVILLVSYFVFLSLDTASHILTWLSARNHIDIGIFLGTTSFLTLACRLTPASFQSA
jgi:hypothetical protein